MRQPPSRTTTRKRAKRQPPRDAVWRIKESPHTPMPTPKEIEVANAADLVKQQRAKRRPRAPQQLTVGYGYYPASDRRAPTLRLRGAGWNNWALPPGPN